MIHRHLEYPPDTPAERLPAAALVDLLERGDLADWKPLAEAVAREPRGPLVARLLDLLAAYPAYGTSALWRAWIERRRTLAEGARAAMPRVTLSELRRRMSLTQAEVALKMGISQSDLSKLERRRDVRLSTLKAYARALGVGLRVLVDAKDGELDIRGENA